MSLDINIKDATNGSYKTKVTDYNALRVTSSDYYEYFPVTKFFSNATYGIDMNKNWSNTGAGNSNELIHNGIDDVAWTASAIAGSWTFNSTANPDTGSKNIRKTSAAINDTAQFQRSSPVTITAQTGIIGRIYITAIGNPIAELLIYAYNTVTGLTVGTPVNIYNYVNTGTTLVYQSFTIPRADMGLTGATFNAIRIRVAVKAGAIFDLDNIYLTDPTGGTAIGTTTFELKPDEGTKLFVDSLVFNMADAYGGTVADGTMPSIPYNGFLGVPQLSNGIVYTLFNNEDVVFTASILRTIDIMSYGNSEIRGYGSDGTNSWLTISMNFFASRILRSETNDRMILRFSDDLSGLLFLRTTAICRQRTLEE